MDLISIRPGRNSQLVWLKFSDGYLLPLKIDDLVTLSLTRNLIITPEKLDQIKNLSLRFLLEEYALRQVAISPKIKQILLPKLKNYYQRISSKYSFPINLSSEVIDDVLDKLDSRGLLNTTDYITYFIKRHPKMSQAQLIFSLKRLGITDDLSSFFEISDIKKISAILLKKCRNRNCQIIKLKPKLFQL